MTWPIDVARSVPEIDRVIVSTDGVDIAAVAREHGAEVFDRPPELATDEAVVADVLRHVIGELRASGETARYIVLLQATSPFRVPDDVSSCLRLLHESSFDSVATFAEARLNPFRAWRLENGQPLTFIHGAVPWRPRQALPDAYQLTGSVYAFEIDRLPHDTTSLLFGRSGAVVLDSSRLLDLDTEFDFVVANALLASGFFTYA